MNDYEIGDRIFVNVLEEHKNIFWPEFLHSSIGYVWQIDDEHVYLRSNSGSINRYPWWAIEHGKVCNTESEG